MCLRPFGLYCSACLGILFVPILCICCSHFSWYSFISFTIFSAPVFSLIHWFFIFYLLKYIIFIHQSLIFFVCFNHMAGLSLLLFLPVSTFSCFLLFHNLIGYVFQDLVSFILCIVDNNLQHLTNKMHNAQCALCVLVQCYELVFRCPCCCLAYHTPILLYI